MNDRTNGLLKPWGLACRTFLDCLETQFKMLNKNGGSDEEYTQQEYLLQELEHLRDAVSETTEDDLEVE